ncbi:cell division protein ZapA [Frigidibacter albus]|uniref:Cell division protein ZapA n=1 Tax=Frigidibacter albus TaxID=1465486 RepID=A0A6L8VJZ7_9RHOB|nr:cell division protein ZapA [Frigidibacter albus]MZQ90675.1 cell division protein ZapA [Frigidibacter albus]NBE32669.1 cell division protein ZapA [Frigidibacter albus]GGH60303.1 cell division protein ZapA [Frigidibacter albus]
MPEVRISIGGREFDVACQDGEDHFLRTAAQMLDTEAQSLVGQLGRMPESRMLLMAGLLLADRTAAMEDQVRTTEERAQAAEAALAELQANPPRIEVPVIPQSLVDTLAEIAARAESLAERVEERAGVREEVGGP